MSLFKLDLVNGYDLVLADNTTVEDLYAVTVANLDRLRQWEQWAHGDPDPEGARSYARANLVAFADGTMMPCVIRHAQRPVGSIALRINTYSAVGELGYWVAADHEGQGAVTRAAEALTAYAFSTLELKRIEIRTAVHNQRSRALAERLGFSLEGTLRSAQPVGDLRHDLAIYGKTA